MFLGRVEKLKRGWLFRNLVIVGSCFFFRDFGCFIFVGGKSRSFIGGKIWVFDLSLGLGII